MKWVKDRTGRFPERPHYLADELDAECEQIVSTFLMGRHGEVRFPITTDDLTVLIERDVADLDLYADLSEEEGQVEGATEFVLGRKPTVRISQALSNTPWLANRLRTTLTHEYGHVRFHRFMFDLQGANLALPFSNEAKRAGINRCLRSSIIEARNVDWMEWQAGYASGALLMPKTALRQQVRTIRETCGFGLDRLSTGGPAALQVISRVAEAFEVSRDAARVRLLQTGFFVDEDNTAVTRSLFRTA